jgi:hypothetical protein
MEITYFYHHPEKRLVKPPDEERGGFYNPLGLVIEGWQEWKATGVRPDPEELARRLNTRWKGDLDYFDEMIQRTRPTKPDADEKP